MKPLNNRRMSDLRGRSMAMIFQEPMSSLNPRFTIGNQLEETLRRHRPVTRREARELSVFLLDKVGITAAGIRLRQYPHRLSGGLRQRVAVIVLRAGGGNRGWRNRPAPGRCIACATTCGTFCLPCTGREIFCSSHYLENIPVRAKICELADK